jgi:hypothetical protein
MLHWVVRGRRRVNVIPAGYLLFPRDLVYFLLPSIEWPWFDLVGKTYMPYWEKAYAPLPLYQRRLRDVSLRRCDSEIPHRLRDEFVRYEHWFWEACRTYSISTSISSSDMSENRPVDPEVCTISATSLAEVDSVLWNGYSERVSLSRVSSDGNSRMTGSFPGPSAALSQPLVACTGANDKLVVRIVEHCTSSKSL